MKKNFIIVLMLYLWSYAHSQSNFFTNPNNKISTYIDSFSYGAIYLNQSINPDSFFSRTKSMYRIGVNDQFKKAYERTDIAGNNHYFYKQYYKGLEVIPMQMNFHAIGNRMIVNGTMVEGLNIDTVNKITRPQAINSALNHFPNVHFLHNKNVNGYQYHSSPKAILTIYCSKDNDFYQSNDFLLAYEVDILIDSPSMESYKVYVNAKNGNIISKIATSHSHNATTCTHLYGTQTIKVQKDTLLFNRLGAKPILFDSANFITANPQWYHPFKTSRYHTFDTSNRYNLFSYFGEVNGWPSQVESTNPYNTANTTVNNATLTNWTCGDTISAISYTAQSHWIASNFLDMLNTDFQYRIRRNMRGNFVTNFTASPYSVTYSTDTTTLKIAISNNSNIMNNAQWNEPTQTMVIGMHDTTTSYLYPQYRWNHCDYLGTIDIVGHELGHMVLFDGIPLIYSKEAGALNESFADVMGYLTERYMNIQNTIANRPTDWMIGEDIALSGTINPNIPYQRSMSNPEIKSQPSIYGGNFWIDTKCCDGLSNDFCGVHTNSGVHNHWFYLMSVGGSKVHSGKTWNVATVGIDTLRRLFFHTFKFVLTQTAKYRDVRNGYLLAVDQLYTGNTSLKNRIAAAWDAVNVRDEQLINFDYHVKDYANPTTKLLTMNNVQNLKFGKNLIVDSTYKLTISGNSVLEFNENSTLEVENTAVLRIDSSILRSIIHQDSCIPSNMWEGIRVFPYLYSHYNPTGAFWMFKMNPLEITNSQISHAIIGVKSGFNYDSEDALGSNGLPIVEERSSHNITINNSNFVDNGTAISFTTEYYRGGFLHFENCKVLQNNSQFILPRKSMIDLYYYQTGLRPVLPSSGHPISDWQIRINNNKINTLNNYSNSLTGIKLKIGNTGYDCTCVVSDDLNFSQNKISNFSTGIKMFGSRFYTFKYDTIELCQKGIEISNLESIIIDSSLFLYNNVSIGLSTYGAKGIPLMASGYPSRHSKISNNIFTGTLINSSLTVPIDAKAIYISGLKDVEISNNIIEQGYINIGGNVNSYTGIHINKTQDVKIKDNGFTTPYSSYNTKPAVAFFSENNATNLNAFSRNTIDNYWHVGAWVWGENRNLRMRCNQFGSPANAAILVQGNLRDQGLPDGIDSSTGCNKDIYPAANVFQWLPSHSSACGSSPETAIKVDTSKSQYRFYYNTQSRTGPSASSPQTPDPLCRTSTYSDTKWKYNACPFPTDGGKFGNNTCGEANIFNLPPPLGGSEGLPCEEISPYIDTFHWRVVDLRDIIVNTPNNYQDFVSYAEHQQIYHGLAAKSKTIQVAIRKRCPDTLPVLEDFLEDAPLWEDRVDFVEYCLNAKKWTKATIAIQRLDSFYIESKVYRNQTTLSKLVEDKEDLKYLYTKEKAMLQAIDNADTSFGWSENDMALLYSIQAKQSYAGAVAERLIAQLTDTMFIHPLPTLPPIDTVVHINWAQYYNDYPVMIYPNPSDGFIRFEFDVPTPIETAYITIVKLSNPSTYLMTDAFTENNFSRIYDLTTYADGIYIMAININGTFVTAKQFKIER